PRGPRRDRGEQRRHGQRDRRSGAVTHDRRRRAGRTRRSPAAAAWTDRPIAQPARDGGTRRSGSGMTGPAAVPAYAGFVTRAVALIVDVTIMNAIGLTVTVVVGLVLSALIPGDQS